MITKHFKTILFAVPLFCSALLFSQDYSFAGTHFTASYKGCDHQALTNISKLKEKMLEAANASGAKILGLADYVFEPDGYTMVVLLSESHASIHTYPEFDSCFVDLFTCGNTCSSEKFDAILKEYLKPTQVVQDLSDRK